MLTLTTAKFNRQNGFYPDFKDSVYEAQSVARCGNKNAVSVQKLGCVSLANCLGGNSMLLKSKSYYLALLNKGVYEARGVAS